MPIVGFLREYAYVVCFVELVLYVSYDDGALPDTLVSHQNDLEFLYGQSVAGKTNLILSFHNLNKSQGLMPTSNYKQ